MANHEQLEKLKQDVNGWNIWRTASPTTQIDLSGANLSEANLSGADLSEANLSFADFSLANLSGATLSGATLSDAYLGGTYLGEANLSFADLSGAYLFVTDLTKAIVGWTNFNNINLETVKGLETVRHEGPSYLDYYTFVNSHGNISKQFLRGAGLSDTFIEYIHSLVNKPIDYYSCFISYSSKNSDFARKLYNDLQGNNVRCWFAPHDMRIGDKILEIINRRVRDYEKLLLVLSKDALQSSWVEDEVMIAFEKERDLQQQGKPHTVLFPVRLDNTINSTKAAWASKVRQRHIGDFTQWKQYDHYQQGLQQLLRDLRPAQSPEASS
jgi:TIR domain/Pentapeptide repeats (8 copies)